MEWRLADAKNRLSEIVSRALTEGPQRIHRRNDTVVVISEQELNAWRGGANPLVDYLMSGPGLEEVDLTRDPSPMRDVNLRPTSGIQSAFAPGTLGGEIMDWKVGDAKNRFSEVMTRSASVEAHGSVPRANNEVFVVRGVAASLRKVLLDRALPLSDYR